VSVNILEKNEHVLAVVKSTTVDVFNTMLGMTVTPKEAFVETKNTTSNAGLMAVLGMAGAVSGSGSLCLSEAMACRAASRFLMAEYDEVNDEVLDAVSELCNMIVGGLKTTLEEEFGPMGLSMPTVVYGKDYTTRVSNLGERINVGFIYEEDGLSEQFHVNVCMISESSNRNYLRELAKFHAQLA
jgi:CheY-specific phosphatase CheX